MGLLCCSPSHMLVNHMVSPAGKILGRHCKTIFIVSPSNYWRSCQMLPTQAMDFGPGGCQKPPAGAAAAGATAAASHCTHQGVVEGLAWDKAPVVFFSNLVLTFLPPVFGALCSPCCFLTSLETITTLAAFAAWATACWINPMWPPRRWPSTKIHDRS